LLPRALERVAAGDPGDVQPTEGVSWAGHFEDDDYVRVDWGAPARSIHNQVRAWHLTFGMSGIRAPIADVDGAQVVLLQTRLSDPGGDARRVECGDGPIWIVASEPV
jgi:methionyl-tRNA formyltransferase